MQHTISSVRTWAIGELKQAHVNSPVLTADLLLGFVLGWTRVRILSYTEQAVSEAVWERTRELIRRCAGGEPLQYLTGEQEFFGLAFQVSPDVLIPRPETEVLVEKAIELIKSYPSPAIRFADVGTGSGCIAVSIAHHIPSSSGWAVDISEDALKIAIANAARNGVADRIRFVPSDLLGGIPLSDSLDFIFCNPPYIALGDYDSLPSEVKNHEPHMALFGGQSGLEVYRRLIPEAASRLVESGYLLLEVGAGQARQVGRIFKNNGFSLQTVLGDLQGIPRCLVGQKTSLER
jgi:release factor glutamine methyltransferase